MADPLTTEELRWRIRWRTDHLSPALDGMIGALADELKGELRDLMERVQSQADKPHVQPVGLRRHIAVSDTLALVDSAIATAIRERDSS